MTFFQSLGLVAGKNTSCALATLVRTSGSTYRQPGSRLIVTSEGEVHGVLSGGCLEDEIATVGRNSIRSGLSQLLQFDTRKLYGCEGFLEIFVEKCVVTSTGDDFLSQLQTRLLGRSTCLVRTTFLGEDQGSQLPEESHTAEDPRRILLSTIFPPIRLVVFGSGPEISPLMKICHVLGWLVDLYESAAELPSQFNADAQTAALIMTHNFGRDLSALHRLLPLPLRYVGLLGPRRRQHELVGQLHDFGFEHSEMNILYSPAGLDIGSDGPEEIALAITAEVAAVLSGRSGGFLRHRIQPIHTSTTAAA